MGRLLAVALVVLAGCSARQRSSTCGPTAAMARGTLSFPPPGRPETINGLRPFRSYLAVERVGPLAHHFTVFYRDIDDGACEVVVTAGLPHQTAVQGCDVGGVMPTTPLARNTTPVYLGWAADEAARAVCAVTDRKDMVVVYGGTYREVQVHEGIPYTADGRVGIDARVDLAVNEGLDRIIRLTNSRSGWGAIEWPGASRRWVNYVAPTPLAGRSLLHARTHALPEAGTVWTQVEPELLLAARTTGVDLAGLQDLQGPTLLPADLAQNVEVIVGITGRPDHGGALRALLSAREAIFGTARGVAEVTVGSTRFTLWATLQAVRPASPGDTATGVRAPFTLDLAIADGRGPPHSLRFELGAELHLDRGNAAFVWIERRDLNTEGAHDRDRFELPGAGPVSSFAVRFDRVFPLR